MLRVCVTTRLHRRTMNSHDDYHRQLSYTRSECLNNLGYLYYSTLLSTGQARKRIRYTVVELQCVQKGMSATMSEI